ARRFGYIAPGDVATYGRTFSWITIETPDGALYYKDIGVNAAQAAIAQGHSEVLRVILNHWISKHGADGRDQHGTSVLMLAAAGGDLELVEELLSYEVPVNITTDVGTTALMMAAAWDQTECVKKLLDAGADRSLVNGHGYTALDLALENGHQETAEVLQ
ncbi:MAG: ankyrin repeat domain-containing protein, partial [Gemmatimonadota bacterium]|nr:ankyrin repeat domain-containing protein [Gemmatimonadota bacterium]